MDQQQYEAAQILFETYDERVENNSLTIEQAWADQCAAEAMAKRKVLLVQCDWTQLPDVSVDKEAWAAYRQALRDMTNQEGYPLEIIWPEAPSDATSF